jgi:hypothetical protein
MRITLALSLVLLCGAVLAQKPAPTIKGHRVGEDILDYLIVAHGSRDAAQRSLQDCGAFLADPKNQKRYARSPDFSKDNELSFRAKVEGCIKVSDALAGKTALLVDGLESYFFVDKKLVIINLQRVDSFEKVVHDLSEKFGQPDVVEDVKYQNGFGAVFTHPRASWNNRVDVMIVADESAEALDIPGSARKFYPISVMVEDRAYGLEQLSKERSKPNSLD